MCAPGGDPGTLDKKYIFGCDLHAASSTQRCRCERQGQVKKGKHYMFDAWSTVLGTGLEKMERAPLEKGLKKENM